MEEMDNDMESKKAVSVLRNMGAELVAGRTWKIVYAKFSSNHLCYKFDGVVSPYGFDIKNYTMVITFPRSHLKELFHAKSGFHVIETSDAVYLYYIEAYFNGFANRLAGTDP
jgi:hypothetical protein